MNHHPSLHSSILYLPQSTIDSCIRNWRCFESRYPRFHGLSHLHLNAVEVTAQAGTTSSAKQGDGNKKGSAGRLFLLFFAAGKQDRGTLKVAVASSKLFCSDRARRHRGAKRDQKNSFSPTSCCLGSCLPSLKRKTSSTKGREQKPEPSHTLHMSCRDLRGLLS